MNLRDFHRGGKILKEFIFSKVLGLEPEALLKTEFLCRNFARILLTFQEKLFEGKHLLAFCKSLSKESKYGWLATRNKQNILMFKFPVDSSS